MEYTEFMTEQGKYRKQMQKCIDNFFEHTNKIVISEDKDNQDVAILNSEFYQEEIRLLMRQYFVFVTDNFGL